SSLFKHGSSLRHQSADGPRHPRMRMPSMRDDSEDEAPSATPFWRRPSGQTALAASAILTVGLIVGGYLLGDGLTRAREADRSVTVRGLAEKDVMADLAIWTISYSS